MDKSSEEFNSLFNLQAVAEFYNLCYTRHTRCTYCHVGGKTTAAAIDQFSNRYRYFQSQTINLEHKINQF